MAYYEGYDFQGYQDAYVQDAYNQGYQDPYSQGPFGYEGYEGFGQDYGYDNFQPDGTPPPPPDKNWEDPVFLNRSYLEKIEKQIVTEGYRGLNELNMYLFEVLVSDLEIKNEIVVSEHFKDKSPHDFFVSVKILHCPFMHLSDTKKNTLRSSNTDKSQRTPSYTNLFQTVYTEADQLVTLANKKQSVDTTEPEGSDLVSIAESSTESIKERTSSIKKEEIEQPPKDTTTFSLQLGKSTLFTMTGLSMLKTLMKHDIRIRLCERVTVEVSESESEDEYHEEVKKSSKSSSAKSSIKESRKGSKDTGNKSFASKETLGSKSKSLESRHANYTEGALLGTTTVRISSLLHQAVLRAARPDANPPLYAPENRFEEFYPLVNDEGEEIGSVGMSITLTCFGRAAVNCIRENINGAYEFEHTLFLNTKRFEPSRKSEEPPRMNPRLARFIMNLGPVIPASKTSAEILQECLDSNRIQGEDLRMESTKKNYCDWNLIARQTQRASESVWVSGESSEDLNKKLKNDFGTRWTNLRRICREMREKMVDDEPKKNSLYERLEEMRMSVDEANSIGKEEIESAADEEDSSQHGSPAARSYTNSASLRSNSSRSKPNNSH